MNVSSWIMDHFNKGHEIDATAAAEGYAAKRPAVNPYQEEPQRLSWFFANLQRFEDDSEGDDELVR